MTLSRLYFFFLIFTFYIEALSPTNRKNIVIPLTGLGDYLYTLSVEIGTPPQLFSNFGYDITAYTSYVNGINCKNCNGTKFDHNKSGTFLANGTKKTEEYALGIMYGSYNQDVIRISNISTTLNYFILSENISFPESKLNLDGIIGFGLDYSRMNINTSILDKIMLKLTYSNRIFSQKIINDSYGELILGQLPLELFKETSKYETCKFLENNIRWGCNMSHILIGNNYKSLDDGYSLSNENFEYSKTYFSTLYSNIIAPQIYLKMFSKFYFKEMLNNQGCFIKNSEENTDVNIIFCNDYTLKLLPDLNFVFDNVAFKISRENLFKKKNEGIWMFNILFHKLTRSWYIGQCFLKNYLVVFDGHNKQIGFHGEGSHNFNISSRYIWHIILFCGLIFISLNMILFLNLGQNQRKLTNPQIVLEEFKEAQAPILTSCIKNL